MTRPRIFLDTKQIIQNAAFPTGNEIQWSVIERSRYMQHELEQLEGTKGKLVQIQIPHLKALSYRKLLTLTPRT